MKIVLDFRMFSPAFGLGRYNQQLLQHLFLVDQQNDYVVLMREEPEGISWPHNFHLKIVNIPWYGLAEQIFLPFIIYGLRPDLVHFPHFNVPFFYRGKYIITIHDLIMSRFPSIKASTLGRLAFRTKHKAYDLIIRNAIKKADKIIAVSNFTKQDIVEYFKLKDEQAEKIKVVYEGVSLLPQPDTLLKKNTEHFFLYVGAAYPHKNLEFLIEAFSHFHQLYPEYKLILIGKRNYFYNRLEKFANEKYATIKDKVIFKGFVPDAELGGYYKNAMAYIFPSLYEGFGLPPLESMQYGTPVLSSRSSCLPEVLGQTVLYFDPKRIDDLVNKMEIIIRNEELKNKLVQSGYELIKKYDWKKMAEQIRDIYVAQK